jgi:peptidoglycan hydrolase-like protein with peptidoglycan-binding domain
MASSRKPGVAGSDLVPSEINDGTLCRQASPLPGSVAGDGALQTNKPRRFVRNSNAVLVFREGNRGPQVTKLQKLLNARLTPSPGLKIDGYFGPQTRATVLLLQKAAAITRDGVAGKATWFHLVSNEEVTVKGVPAPKVSVTPNPKSSARFTRAPVVTTPSVLDWSLQAKFIRVIELVPSKLPQELGNTFRTMVA